MAVDILKNPRTVNHSDVCNYTVLNEFVRRFFKILIVIRYGALPFETKLWQCRILLKLDSLAISTNIRVD